MLGNTPSSGSKRRKITSSSPKQPEGPQTQPSRTTPALSPRNHQQTEQQSQHAAPHPIDLAFASASSEQQHQNHNHRLSSSQLLPLPPPRDSAARRLSSTPWARHEFFYCDLDRTLFREGRNDFQTCLNRITVTPSAPSLHTIAPDVGIGAIKMTRDEWAVVRCLMGRPRRLSHRFLTAERERFTGQRHRLRKLQLDLINNTFSENDNDFESQVPDDIPPPMVVGQKVVARYTLPTPHIPPSSYASFHPGELAPGTIIAMDLPNCRYRVMFDTWETDIGWVDDTDLMSVGSLKLIPWRPDKDKGATFVYPVSRSPSATNHLQNIPHPPDHQCTAYCFADSMNADQVLNALLTELRIASGQKPDTATPYGQWDDADLIFMLAIINTLTLKKSMVDCLKSMNHTAQDMLKYRPRPYAWNVALRDRYLWLVDRISLIDRVFPFNIPTVEDGFSNGANVVSERKKMAAKDALPQRHHCITTGLDLLSELSMKLRSVKDSDNRNNVATPIPDCADEKSAHETAAYALDSVIAPFDGSSCPNPTPALKGTRERVEELIDKCVALLVHIREIRSLSNDGQSRDKLTEALKAMLPTISSDCENVSDSKEEQANVLTNSEDNLSVYKEIEHLVLRMHPQLFGVLTSDEIR